MFISFRIVETTMTRRVACFIQLTDVMDLKQSVLWHDSPETSWFNLADVQVATVGLLPRRQFFFIDRECRRLCYVIREQH